MKSRSKRCVIFGSGGHARCVIETIQLENKLDLIGIIAQDETQTGESLEGISILGSDQTLGDVINQYRVDYFIIGIGGVGNNNIRKAVWDRALSMNLKPLTTIHPSAIVSPRCAIGAGSYVGPGAIINIGAVIGENVLINSAALIEHDCKVGNHVHLAPGSKLCGTVTIGDLSHIGTGVVVKQGITIGSEVIVGVGGVVVKNVPSKQTVYGNPAREKILI